MSKINSAPLFPVIDKPQEKKKVPTKKKILIIDDSSTIRGHMRQILSGYTFVLIESDNGEKGYASLLANPDTGIVFCDVNMPVLDGLSFVEKIKAEAPQLNSIPIVMLTTESSKDLVLRGKAAGISAWIIKPPVPAKVMMCVEKFMQ